MSENPRRETALTPRENQDQLEAIDQALSAPEVHRHFAAAVLARDEMLAQLPRSPDATGNILIDAANLYTLLNTEPGVRLVRHVDAMSRLCRDRRLRLALLIGTRIELLRFLVDSIVQETSFPEPMFWSGKKSRVLSTDLLAGNPIEGELGDEDEEVTPDRIWQKGRNLRDYRVSLRPEGKRGRPKGSPKPKGSGRGIDPNQAVLARNLKREGMPKYEISRRLWPDEPYSDKLRHRIDRLVEHADLHHPD
jgi:hypothetical protein